MIDPILKIIGVAETFFATSLLNTISRGSRSEVQSPLVIVYLVIVESLVIVDRFS